MNKHFGRALRMTIAGTIAVGGAIAPLALAGAEDNCATASPSDTSCGPTTTVPATVTTPPTTAAPKVESKTEEAPKVVQVLGTSVAAKSELAFTGGDAVGIAAIGLGAVAVGGASMAASKRRRQN